MAETRAHCCLQSKGCKLFAITGQVSILLPVIAGRASSLVCQPYDNPHAPLSRPGYAIYIRMSIAPETKTHFRSPYDQPPMTLAIQLAALPQACRSCLELEGNVLRFTCSSTHQPLTSSCNGISITYAIWLCCSGRSPEGFQTHELVLQDHMPALASGIMLMLSEVTSEYEALGGMHDKALSIGQPFSLGEKLLSPSPCRVPYSAQPYGSSISYGSTPECMKACLCAGGSRWKATWWVPCCDLDDSCHAPKSCRKFEGGIALPTTQHWTPASLC